MHVPKSRVKGHKTKQNSHATKHSAEEKGGSAQPPSVDAAEGLQTQQQHHEQQQPAQSPPTPPTIITSRLCIKNVPKDMTVPKLREHFAAKGEVTDAKILKTRDGQSRQMAFVGFKTSEDAAAAQKYFNNTFIYASRITVEFAVKFHDPLLARPWSKHSEGSSAQQRLQQQQQQQEQKKQEQQEQGSKRKAGKKGAVIDGNAAEAQALAARLKSRGVGQKKGEEGEEDPKLAEFLALMAPRNRAKLWTNDDLLPEQTLQDLQGKAASEASDSDGEEDTMHAASSSSDDEYDDIDAPGVARHDKTEEDSSKEIDKDIEDIGEDDDTRNAPKDVTVLSEGVSDLDYLKSRMRKWTDNDEEEEEEDEEEDGAVDAKRRGDQSGVGPSRSATPPAPSQTQAGQKEAKKAATPLENGSRTAAKGPAEGPAAMEVDGLREGVSDEGESGSDREDGGAGKKDQQRRDRGSVEAEVREGGTADRDGSLPPDGGNQGHAQGPQVVDAVADGSNPLDLIADTGRLFVRNLAYSTTEADLAELFGQFGDVSEVHVVLDRETKRSKGIAYVLFVVPSDAVNAYQQMDGQIFQGRLIHILPAKRPPSIEKSGVVEVGAQGKGAGSSFKTEREQQRKNDAGNRAAWNSLFIRPDTVAEAVAAHYGVSKSELMDAHAAGDLAVRMALGEAAVVAQTKTALAEEGVDVSKLEAAAAASGKASAVKAVARSDRTVLVKNLPYSASEEDLHAMFSRYGPLARLVLPPSHALALVEYNEPQDARSAFKALAYKKYQHVPLYLEWAPQDIFSIPPPPPQEQLQAKRASQPAAQTHGEAAAVPAVGKKKQSGVEALEGVQGGGDEGDEDSVSTLYVKNLAFATTDAGLRKHFDKAVSSVGGTLHSACVAKRKGPKGELLSAGFGFVEVNSPEVANLVIKQLQGSMLDNHKLSMQLSKRRAPSASAAAAASKGSKQAAGTADGGDQQQAAKTKKGDGATTKLLVRNVAFEATRKDILGLVTPFGHLKSCRLPKKFDGNHRGYAFVEFVTKQEARNALEGVGGVHLYGRRLVVEYAKDEEGLDELRSKTAAKFKGDDAEVLAPAAKRLRKDL